MNNSFLVEITKSQSNLYSVELNLILLESSSGFEETIKLTTFDERHDKEQSQVGHEKVLHSYQELMLTFKHDILL